MRKDVEQLIGQIEAALREPTSKSIFWKTLLHAIEVLDLTDERIARQFGASRPTVTRWRNGSNAPHAALHPTVYSWMLSEAKGRLRRIEQAAQERRRAEEAEQEQQSQRRPQRSTAEHAIAAAGPKR